MNEDKIMYLAIHWYSSDLRIQKVTVTRMTDKCFWIKEDTHPRKRLISCAEHQLFPTFLEAKKHLLQKIDKRLTNLRNELEKVQKQWTKMWVMEEEDVK